MSCLWELRKSRLMDGQNFAAFDPLRSILYAFWYCIGSTPPTQDASQHLGMLRRGS